MIPSPRPIANTLMANSNPLSLALGFSLFPTLFPSPVGLGRRWTGTIWSHNHKFLGIGITTEASYNVFFGIHGPSWNTSLRVAGSYGLSDVSGSEILLDNGATETIAGLIIGASAGVTVSVDANIIFRRINFNFSPTIDLIQIGFTILQAVLGGNGKFLTKVANVVPSALSSWGAFDSSGATFARSGGEISVSPNFQVPINLWGLLVLADRSSGLFSGVLIAADGLLSATLSSITVGPVIGLGVRARIRLVSLTLDNVTFEQLNFVGDRIAGRSSSTAIPAQAGQLTMNFQQQPFFDVQFGFTAQLQLFQIFNIGGTFTFSVLQALNINIPLGGPYSHSLGRPVGSQTAMEWREVEFV